MSEKDAKDYADSIHAIFVETSAKNAININEVFREISESLYDVAIFASVFMMLMQLHISFNIRIVLFWPNLCLCERRIKQMRLLHLQDLAILEPCTFCHQTYFSIADFSSSPF